MSYADISKIVGTQKASTHYHFPIKEKLVAALLDRYDADFLKTSVSAEIEKNIFFVR